MLEFLSTVATTANSFTPLGIIALLGCIIYLLVSKNGPIKTISDNHLSGLPDMAASMNRMEGTLLEIRDGINFLKGRQR